MPRPVGHRLYLTLVEAKVWKGERWMVISLKPSYPVLPNAGGCLVGRPPSRLGQDNRDGRLPRAIRRLDPVGGQAADRIPTPLVPGRGGHGPVRRQCPASRVPLRLGARDGREGSPRAAARRALPGELRRTGPAAERAEGPATGGRHPRHRRAPYLRRSGTEVGAAVHQPVGGRGARRLDREGLSRRGVAQPSARCGTSSIG